MNLTGTDCFQWCETLQNDLSKSDCKCFYRENEYHTSPDFVNIKLLYNELHDMIFPVGKNQNKKYEHFKNISNQNEQKQFTRSQNLDQDIVHTSNSLILNCLAILLSSIFVY